MFWQKLDMLNLTKIKDALIFKNLSYLFLLHYFQNLNVVEYRTNFIMNKNKNEMK